MNFTKTGLSQAMIDNLDSMGYVNMTPIQEKGLPYILKGQDFIGQATTGSGKTAAFALGILNQIDIANPLPQGLVIVPSRELAEQVAIEIRRLARFTSNIKVLTLTGGLEEHHKVKSLKKGAHIIVGTTGRLLKLLETKVLHIYNLKVLVIDEADRLLECGSLDDINRIASYTPVNRQTMLFSATFPHGIKTLSASLQEDAVQVTIDSQHETNTITQSFIQVDGDKHDALVRVLAAYQPESCLIFCNSRIACNQVAARLRRKKIETLQIHADLEQQDRTLTLIKFANKSCRILVATDLASRGLDVKDVGLVINFDMPSDSERYVHRIGRTGRAGQRGTALSLFVETELALLEKISTYLKVNTPLMRLDKLQDSDAEPLSPCPTTIYISGGRKNNIRPGDILGALTKDAGLQGSEVGKIQVLDINSYVAVASDKVDQAIDGLTQGKIKGKKFKVGKA